MNIHFYHVYFPSEINFSCHLLKLTKSENDFTQDINMIQNGSLFNKASDNRTIFLSGHKLDEIWM